MSAAAHIARAKRYGVPFERFADRDILQRNNYVCQVCRKACNRQKRAPHPDAATVGHRIALSCGGEHKRANCECQCWACNAEQNNEIDTPTAARIKRRRGETGQRARRERRKAEGKPPLIQGKTKIESRGFDRSLRKKMNGEVIRNG